MKIYWLPSSIPELSDLTKKERDEVWRKIYFKLFKHWQVWVAFLAPLAFALWCGMETAYCLHKRDFTRISFILSLVGMIGSLPFALNTVASHARPKVRKALDK